MVQSRPKPSEVAAEAKRIYHPHIARHYIHNPVTSYLYSDGAALRISPDKKSQQRLRVAVVEGDAVDYALGWYQYAPSSKKVPVVNMANEKRAGGDWESGLMAPEECFARRSNLVQALTMPYAPKSRDDSFYPLPQRGGLYTPEVYVFREGPEHHYTPWKEIKSLPVISVAPVRRPKLDESGLNYSFAQEKELMREKMRSVLRIALHCGHSNICIGAFGVGPIFRNPVGEVARMWRRLLFEEEEFCGVFTDVVFAIENTNATTKAGMTDVDIFKAEFDPSTIFPTRYR